MGEHEVRPYGNRQGLRQGLKSLAKTLQAP